MIITIGIIDRDQEGRDQLIAIFEGVMPDPVVSKKPDLLVSFARESFDPANIRPNECHPDIVLIDIEGQEEGSIRNIKTLYPQSQVIVVSHTIDTNIVLKAYRDGAANYVQKSTARQFIYYAILSAITATSTGNYGRYPHQTKYPQN